MNIDDRAMLKKLIAEDPSAALDMVLEVMEHTVEPTKQGQMRMWMDQYGRVEWARTVKELREKVGGSVSKMYQDKKDGRTVHVGYVIGSQWFTGYLPWEMPA